MSRPAGDDAPADTPASVVHPTLRAIAKATSALRTLGARASESWATRRLLSHVPAPPPSAPAPDDAQDTPRPAAAGEST